MVDENLQNEETNSADAPERTPAEDNLVKQIRDKIKQDKAHFKSDFDRMREDMYVARNGADKAYAETPGYYKANLAGRHVKQKTAALYAKNPKATARRRETLDFILWDEDPQSIEMAMQIVMTASEQMQAAAPDPVTGEPVAPEVSPLEEQAVVEAQRLIEDFQQGNERRELIKKIGRTLEVLFAQALREQRPLDGKTAMKKLVRRALTTGVGYVELGFQRETGPRAGLNEQLADARVRLDHLRALAEAAAKGEADGGLDSDDAEIAELQMSIAALEQEPEIVLREGLVLDFPASTRVIPDRLTQSLVGFVGSRHLTIEYLFTADQVKEIFGVDLGKNYRGYSVDGKTTETDGYGVMVDDEAEAAPAKDGDGLACVWKHYDKPSGLVYYLVDGYKNFLREPAPPDVFVEDFWPVYALTFNDVESEDKVIPPSDVRLILDMQTEYNQSRQGMREHRKAARPRWGIQKGAVEEADLGKIASASPFDVTQINMTPGTKLADIFDAVPIPGVDPNLYEPSPFFQDIGYVVGSNEAQFGGLSRATATESAIAAGASASTDQSSIDDLDSFLTVIARASGQILLREMSEEQVKIIAGAGAVWPDLPLSEIASELFLEVEAGSTGKPNQAVEINNWKQMLPFLLQMPGISPVWLARETLRRLDDRMDLTEALSQGAMSVMAMNKLSQMSAGPPQQDPNAQGDEGGDNAPRQTEQQGGSDAAFGSNQV